MTLSIRLDQQTQEALRQHLEQSGVTQSTFVREAIREKLARYAPEASTPYQLGEPLFGRYASGETNRSQQRKALIRERLDAKHRR
ncbi:MAG: ribbon-helix-helix protein, CopG family [Lamprobacter sp.]|uniref:ribbon-helix-helix protein, CopG family n=1 Tax=Lamprobacter sp. TaxID=3100796 RepID=UPI002B25A003|nr:ribbon-helix-helix protein, CopG family [Lamprobacter sp.]MEA3642047.1 ribbon-helix-helix protein, CopG family [Lamprobacter sp.]